MWRVAFSLVVVSGSTALAADPLPQAAIAASQADPFTIDEGGRLSIAVNHTYARSEAKERVGYLLAYWKKRFNITNEWRGNRVFLSGTVYGIKIQAMFEVEDSAIVGFAHDPGWPWRGQVSSYVDRKLKKYLHPNYDEP